MTDSEAAVPVDLARIEHAVREILAAIGEDPDRDGLVRTPTRVADPYEDTAMKSNSTGRSIARARSAMNMKAPLRMPTSSGGFAA